MPVVPRKASADDTNMGADLEQRIVRLGRLVEIDHDRNLARLRGAAHRRDEFGKAVVDQHRVGVRDQSGGIGRQHLAEIDAAARGDGLLAGRIEQNERHRGGAAVHTRHPAAVDALLGEVGENAVAHMIVRAAERAGEGHACAQPRAPGFLTMRRNSHTLLEISQ